MQDFQTRENRLKKRDYSADFRLADNDDFFGFSQQREFTLLEMAGLLLVGLPVLYAIVWLFLAITPNI
jgi:hypothetical protein